jgi:hypothetical protein
MVSLLPTLSMYIYLMSVNNDHNKLYDDDIK